VEGGIVGATGDGRRQRSQAEILDPANQTRSRKVKPSVGEVYRRD